ncbi:protein-S-isoprenylcysteine O-methyltransferase Ste14 [Chryseobacterium defluvii]|uniref:Protein-S-isoprenylcysteine O-methyltransferase Ste14 n=1 Tax=Chryseobacterium defluvii TaxID=160396 RepID=A0A840KBU0_9FLAO|nr:isoprenylcysteine carboxylmethyltransferase family protein [Chryseobacterium defluvii]MBB4806909.1 protein-S-isoprenylcysteine O-methyltransferase Ste14 [Chryseobacterium defluvii]
MGTIFYISMAVWFLTEIIYRQKLKSEDKDQKKDRSTLGILWMVIMISVAAAVTISYTIKLPVTDNPMILIIGESLILLGIIFRLIIIWSLGKYFTVDVSIKTDHKIKKEGFYKYIRHPSYAFSLLTFLGLGLFLNNWISLIIAFIPPFLAFSYRIRIEEQALVEQFGDEYIQYRKTTKKLVPFIY